jgi:hypothetical protein
MTRGVIYSGIYSFDFYLLYPYFNLFQLFRCVFLRQWIVMGVHQSIVQIQLLHVFIVQIQLLPCSYEHAQFSWQQSLEKNKA